MKVIILSFIVIILTASAGVFWYLKKPSKDIISIDSVPQQDAPVIQNENSDSRENIQNPNPVTEDKEENNDSTSNKSTEKEDADNNEGIKITNRLVSWGYSSSSGRKIDTIIIHSSYDALGENPYSLSGLINEYKQYGVAPHYLIDRDGNIYRLIEDKNIAYHAGEGKMPDGRTGINNFSIGIELMNTQEDKFSKSQYDSLNELIGYLKDKYKITSTLGHNQVAPGRKTDPWNMDWNKLD